MLYSQTAIDVYYRCSCFCSTFPIDDMSRADFTQTIFRHLDDPSVTLVFPTENTARHWLSSYVRKHGRTVLAERALAFDTFRSMFAPRHDDRPSDKYRRLAFVTSFLDSRKTGMDYLYRDSLYEYRLRFVPFLTRILPSLSEMKGTVVENREIRRDLEILRSAYAAYLSRCGLYEPGWEPHSIGYAEGKLHGKYILVGYDSDIQMQMLMKELGSLPQIGYLNKECSETVKYKKFLTEEAEFRALFLELQKLRKQAVPVEDIIVSTPQMEALRPRLERLGIEYGIPLSFMKSLMLRETVPGRYLFAVRRLLNEDLSFRSMENLLLNCALPFTDMEANRFLIRFMTENNIMGGSTGFSDDVLFTALGREASGKSSEDIAVRAFNLYRNMKSALVAVKRASDGDELIKDIHGLTELLFGPSEFSSSSPKDKDVYSFMFAELAGINTALKESGMVMRDMFSVFMGEVEQLSYVEQEKRDGIRIYSYGQDHLIDVPWHFVIGLNETGSVVRKDALAFLEDHEVGGIRESYDVTDRLLEYYCSCGENVWISGSGTSYSGAQSVPSFFITGDAVEEIKKPDLKDVFGRADKLSLGMSEKTFMARRGEDLAVSGTGPVKDLSEKKLSYTSISNYARCPYRAYLQSGLTSEAPSDFEPSEQDDKEIGTFLHGVIQSFMAAHSGQLLDMSHLGEYHEELDGILRQALEKSRKFDALTKQCIYGNYIEPLKAVLTGLLVPGARRKTGYVGPFTPLCNELPLDGDSSFTGFVDTVIRDAEGNIFLLDYKKGSGDATYQLVLYKRLYELKPPYGTEVSDCFFYSMRDSKYKGIQPSAWVEQEQKLDHDIEAVRSGYSTGNWNATPGKEACRNCEERGICRRRFNLQ